jgi:two-component system, chemotaxis family, protein-glutamate methylesterase/glutaminase
MTINVLVVDDSAFMRRLITDLLQTDPEIRVVGQAYNGQDALSKMPDLNPDVITLDVEMPVMDGLQTLATIMRNAPKPVVMLSAVTKEGAEPTIKALELGAVDFVTKPSGSISMNLHEARDELISKVRAAAGIAPHRIRGLSLIRETARTTAKPAVSNAALDQVVVIGASTGGPKALATVFGSWSDGYAPGCLVVQHMPATFVEPFATRLNTLGPMTVRVAESGDTVTPGTALVAPGGQHMAVGSRGVIKLTTDPPIWGVRPAVDVTMASAAECYKSRTVGALLTGMGRDGTAGMQAIHAAGGYTIAESEETCVVYGMPKVAIESGCVNRTARIEHVAEAIATSKGGARKYA